MNIRVTLAAGSGATLSDISMMACLCTKVDSGIIASSDSHRRHLSVTLSVSEGTRGTAIANSSSDGTIAFCSFPFPFRLLNVSLKRVSVTLCVLGSPPQVRRDHLPPSSLAVESNWIISTAECMCTQGQ